MRWSAVFFLCACFSQIQCTIYSEHINLNRCPLIRLPNGRVRARARGRIVRYTCNDGYTLAGNKYSTCMHGKWDTPIPVCVNSECAELPKPEHAVVAKKYEGAILMYFCEAGYVLVGASEIYCDGRHWNATAPYCRDTNASPPTKCDFEKPDLCWWEQDPLHDFDWRRHNFETPSSHIGTGPSHDHTLGAGNEGYYLYIEASGRLANDIARIVSPLYNSSLTDSGCFSLWFHMYGVGIGALKVYFKAETDTEPRLMFKKEGNQGNQWLHGIFSLPKVDTNFQIIIEGIRGVNYVSDIAIDDIAILQGKECERYLNDTGITVATTTNNDDQVELVSASQTCHNKCNNYPTSHFITVNPQDADLHVYTVEQCQCTIDCAEYSLCCPDYAEYCVLAITNDGITAEFTEAITITATSINNVNVTTLPNITKAGEYETTTLSRTMSRNRIPINPKDDIDPNTTKLHETATPMSKKTTPMTKITTPMSKITTLMSKTTTPMSKTTTPMSKTTTPMSKTISLRPITKNTRTSTIFQRTTLSTVVTKKIPTKKTYIPMSTKHIETTKKYDQQVSVRIENPQKFHHDNGKIGLPGIVGLIIGVVTGIIVVSIVAFFIITRRKTYKRGPGNSSLSEDSDVRFLTSDEILDFNLAKPSDNDDL